MTIICTKCSSEYTYQDGILTICSECGYEWNPQDIMMLDEDELVIKDAYGALLKDGDTIILIKDLKIKGSNEVVKQGTKVKGIRLVGGDHNIDAKVPKFGAMGLKSEFVKKVTE